MKAAAAPVVVLVTARAPVAGQAKTRLGATVGPAAAAELAAASLLDTLAAATATGWPVVVALTGDLDAAARSREIRTVLRRLLVVGQRGDALGERLVAAHRDAAVASGCDRVVQIGMDTPQVTADQLQAASAALDQHGAVLGPATDGGWWLLGVRHPTTAACLAGVAMSRPDTAVLTRDALLRSVPSVGLLATLRDVDTADDAAAVAATAAHTSFARAWAAVAGSGTTARASRTRATTARASHR
ncbi:MAG: TIGR04282 family arsenosugar biosynthesis glycosyltransferase [Nocardioidaceae bacterium]